LFRIAETQTLAPQTFGGGGGGGGVHNLDRSRSRSRSRIRIRSDPRATFPSPVPSTQASRSSSPDIDGYILRARGAWVTSLPTHTQPHIQPRTQPHTHTRAQSHIRTHRRALSISLSAEDEEEVRRMTNINNSTSSSSAFPPLDTTGMGGVGMGGQGRNNIASPTTSGHAGGSAAAANGNGAGNNASNYMATLPVGHQQDLNYLYNQIQELGALLRSNREQVNTITRTAEEVAVCFV